MTNLTEQWKKSKLPDGVYYVKTDWRGDIYTVTSESIKYEDYIDGCKIIEVLVPAPTYEEWQMKLEENEKLKKQLAIAIEALKCYEQENWTYADEYNYIPWKEYTGGWCHAEKALEQIKELDK